MDDTLVGKNMTFAVILITMAENICICLSTK